MPLADINDINLHLPADKISVDLTEYVPFQLDAERIIRGYLAGYYPAATLALWTDPGSTPGMIRGIAGRLVAAFQYRKRYSEDSTDDPEYAQQKYNEAMKFLEDIMAGKIVVEGIVEPTSDRLTSNDFWPNDTAPAPKFTMEMNL